MYAPAFLGMEGLGLDPSQEARWRYDNGLHARMEVDPHQGPPQGGPGPPGPPPPFLVGGPPPRGEALTMKKSASADSLPVFCAAPVDEVSAVASN